MNGWKNAKQEENADKEIIYSHTVRAGKRIYYIDVKRNLRDDYYLAITESKKVQSKQGGPALFEKHKIFIYKEDFEKFMDGMADAIGYIRRVKDDEDKVLPVDAGSVVEKDVDDDKLIDPVDWQIDDL